VGGAQTGLQSVYSKLKVRNPLKIPKKETVFPSHQRMKKILLVATVLLGGLAISQAGVNVRIGIGLPLPPLPRPGIVVRYPAPVCPPVVVVPPVCPPREIVPCPPVRYEPGYGYDYRRGHNRWAHHNNHGRRHRH
jgi:hypothetical protein